MNTGDYLVTPVSSDSVQVYRIRKEEFEKTFTKDDDEFGVFSIEFARWLDSASSASRLFEVQINGPD